MRACRRGEHVQYSLRGLEIPRPIADERRLAKPMPKYSVYAEMLALFKPVRSITSGLLRGARLLGELLQHLPQRAGRGDALAETRSRSVRRCRAAGRALRDRSRCSARRRPAPEQLASHRAASRRAWSAFICATAPASASISASASVEIGQQVAAASRSTMRPKPATRCTPRRARSGRTRNRRNRQMPPLTDGARDSAGAARGSSPVAGSASPASMIRAPSQRIARAGARRASARRADRRAIFLVCSASRETSSSGEPSASVATLTSEQYGSPAAGHQGRQRALRGSPQQRLGHFDGSKSALALHRSCPASRCINEPFRRYCRARIAGQRRD